MTPGCQKSPGGSRSQDSEGYLQESGGNAPCCPGLGFRFQSVPSLSLELQAMALEAEARVSDLQRQLLLEHLKVRQQP